MLTARQNEIIRRLDELDAISTALELNIDAADMMDEYAYSEELLDELVGRYAASPCLHLVKNLTFCLSRRMFSIDLRRGTSLALRIIHFHTCKLDPGTACMIIGLLDLSTLEGQSEGIEQTLADLRKFALMCLEWCPGYNPPYHFWPTLQFLNSICEAGLLDSALTPEDQVYAKDQLTAAFDRHGSSLDDADREMYESILSDVTVEDKMHAASDGEDGDSNSDHETAQDR